MYILEGNAHIYLWTVNGNKIGKVSLEEQVNCVTLSNLHDGIAINVVAGGFQDGTIRSEWDLLLLNNLSFEQNIVLRCIYPFEDLRMSFFWKIGIG